MAYVAFETEAEQAAYWQLMRSLVGDGDDPPAEEGRGFCATGPGGGVDNSCGTKGGDGKGGGGSGKGRKGGRDKPVRIPARKPSRAEVQLASSDGASAKHVAARKVVASHFLHSQGSYFDRKTGKLKPLDRSRYRGQMAGIDWTKPVTVGPPPSMPPPGELVQWQVPGLIPPYGGYFSTPGTEPEKIGIGRKGTLWTDPDLPTIDKVPFAFDVQGSPQYIRSTAAPTVDTWSEKGRVQAAGGGGQQWFMPAAQATGVVKQLRPKRRGPRRSSRAFCPGASPPDNSCSPASKGTGDGGSPPRGKGASGKKAKSSKSPIEKQLDNLAEYQKTFDGSSLARPAILLGMPDFHVDPVKFSRYLESSGKEWQGADLPKGVQRGAMGQCYENATRLVLQSPELDYVEGIAYPAGLPGMGFLHAWAVERRTGRVIDNTWDSPKDCRYFGVQYERKSYMRHVAKTKYYGVVGGDPKVAAAVIKRGAL